MSVATRPRLIHHRLDALAIGMMVVLCALWGVQQVASKVALAGGMPPIQQALLRSLIAGPLLVLWVFARGGRAGVSALLARDSSLKPGIATGIIFAVEFMLLFPGVHLTSASHAVILLFTGGFFTAVGAHLFIPAERLRASQWAGLALAFIGVVATVGKVDGRASLLGDALVLGAAAAWGATAVVVKANPALLKASAEKVLAYQLFGALPVLIIGTFVAGEASIPHATGLAWASLAYQGVVIAFASYLAWYWLVARYPAGHLAAFSFLSPIFGIGAAFILLGEQLSISLFAGFVLVCVGLKLVNR